MKITHTKVWILVVLILLTGIVFFISQLHMNMPQESPCPEQGSGPTTISGKVFDDHTKKLIDSVSLEIRFGMSGDLFLDTTIAQKDSFLFTFNIDPSYHCEHLWFLISHKKYYGESRSYWDYDSTGYITKGGTVSSTRYLKPAARIKVCPEKVLKDSSSLYILLVHKQDSLEYKWSDVYGETNEPNKEDYWEYNDDAVVKARWIVDKQERKDTFYKELKLIPYDTVDLKIRY